MNKITIFLETNRQNVIEDVSFELISKAYALSKTAHELNGADFIVEGIALGQNLDKVSIEKAYNAGCSRVVLIKQQDNSDILCAKNMAQYLNENPSYVVLFPATYFGRIIASRLCTMLDTGLVADCIELDFILKNNELKLASTRPTFGSELMATILSKKNPQCATVRKGIFRADFTKRPENIDFIEYKSDLDYIENRIKFLNSIMADNKENIKEKLAKAKIVLVAGFGLMDAKVDYFKKLKDFAKKIGAEFGVTRKVVDNKICSNDYQIGQTGISINPDLYISFGVSGAIQHISGMKNSKKIAAINIDENADIFKYADYKIVSDAKKIIEELEIYK